VVVGAAVEVDLDVVDDVEVVRGAADASVGAPTVSVVVTVTVVEVT
jgi:hypothetical protein